ncbi:HNH endonuclease [Modestobacter marinus]|uniref:HNH endonuclease n=1 Tax=Modestobacter marinus TaxID=477641 RepID=UPI001C94E4C8|nr:HNH endonuclease signature motif containing protein [Modestobacter marinus]
MGELQSALDALAAEDLSGLFGPPLLVRLKDLLQVQNRIAAEVTRTVRECEKAGAAEFDGLKTMPAWLRGHARLSPAAAGRLVRSGWALEHLPALAEAFAAGTITADQVNVVAPVADAGALAAAAAQEIDLGQVDEALTSVAATQPHLRLGEAVHRYLDALDPDGTEPDPTEGRRLTIAQHADGSITGRFDLDAVGGEKVQAALESIVQAARPKGDTRTRAQQQADALVQLADNALAQGDLPFLRRVKPHVIVTIDDEDLTDTTSTGPAAAQTGFGARISAARARWLACDGIISRMVMGPGGLPLDVGREQRIVPPHIRRAVERRDRHCVFAGCGAPTHWCDVHHLLEWINGGETSLENSALLCERHHTKVHHGFRVDRDDAAPPGSRWRTYRPDGTEILIHPRL